MWWLLAGLLVLAGLAWLVAVAAAVRRHLAELARVAELSGERMITAQAHAMRGAGRLQAAATDLQEHLARLERARPGGRRGRR